MPSSHLKCSSMCLLRRGADSLFPRGGRSSHPSSSFSSSSSSPFTSFSSPSSCLKMVLYKRVKYKMKPAHSFTFVASLDPHHLGNCQVLHIRQKLDLNLTESFSHLLWLFCDHIFNNSLKRICGGTSPTQIAV